MVLSANSDLIIREVLCIEQRNVVFFCFCFFFFVFFFYRSGPGYVTAATLNIMFRDSSHVSQYITYLLSFFIFLFFFHFSIFFQVFFYLSEQSLHSIEIIYRFSHT